MTQLLVIIVQSSCNPDTPLRIFRNFSDEWSCPERLWEEDMCIYEILGKDGFNECFLLPRHFKQECVSGSFVGWIASQENTIDNLIGFDTESLLNKLMVTLCLKKY